MENSSYDNSIEELLNEKVFDQQEAVSTLTKSLLQSSLLKSKKKKVRALFTFIGLANSGKHYLARMLLDADKELENIKTFNMEQYGGNLSMGMEQLSLPSITSEVVEFVKEHPKSILVFEDIEKGDFQTQLALYSLFGGNEVNDVDFSKVVVVMLTTKLGSLVQRQDFKELQTSDPLQAHTYLMEKLAQESIMVNGVKEEAFDKKLLSLLNEHTVIPFNRLSLSALIKIAARTIHDMSHHFAKDSKLEIEYLNFDKLAALLTLSLSPYINARHVIKKVPELIFTQVYEAVKKTPKLEAIHFDVLDDAAEFVNSVLKEQHAFIKKISQQHMRITLEWEITKEGNSVTCKIKNALYAKEKLSILTPDALHVSDVNFSDVAGQQRVKDELQEVLALLKEPQRLKEFDMTPPKGMFLYGPHGMGKKLLARAFANEIDMPFIVVSGADLFDAAKIHKAYSQAFVAAPAIVLLEDIDTPGVVNGVISLMNTGPVADELDMLNGSFDSPVFTIATLSSVENIPEELSKAGRLDIRIEVPKLDMEARRFFIEEVLKKPHEKKIDVEKVVRYISGLSGNELQRIGQEAALQAARKGLKELTEEILLEQINIIKYGTKLESKQIRDIEKSMAKTAYHEAGHAVLSYVLLPDIKIEQVTVAPRSESLGFVSYHNEEYVDATSKEELFNDVCVLLAGRIAKMEKFGEEGMETGAINDLEVASLQVYAAIAFFGMDDELGYLNVSGVESAYDRKLFSRRIEERMIAWIEEAKHKTQREVKRLWPAIEAVAKRLIKKEVIDGEELKKIINKKIPQA
ncbi:MAG: AAA family ATPase [Sulfurimonas sp.]